MTITITITMTMTMTMITTITMTIVAIVVCGFVVDCVSVDDLLLFVDVVVVCG